MNLEELTTESRNSNTTKLDQMSPIEIMKVMNAEDQKVPKVISKVLPNIAKAVSWAEESLINGGRIIYVGAGTSGRLGVLDAAECPPTFGVSDDVVVGIIAGGKEAFLKAVEGAEDNKELGREDLRIKKLKSNDLVIGIAASGRTPYVVGAIEYAKEAGCRTIAIACNKDSLIGRISDHKIEVEVGPEVLTGSTRLKAGTAQKLILNMISTGAMVRTGKAYKNLMVDVIQTNEKLQTRAENIIIEATGVDRKKARETIDKADGSVKTALTMILLDCTVEDAKSKLKLAGGHIYKAIEMNND